MVLYKMHRHIYHCFITKKENIMKKIFISLLVICTMLFMTSPASACNCGCNKTNSDCAIECSKDCPCGCQNGEECKCKKQCPKKECCKKCPCGCQNGGECKCKKECAEQKCNKEKTLFEEIKDSTATEEISDTAKPDCGCKRDELKSKCKKSKCFKKCLKKCKKLKKGCPIEDIVE